MDSRQDASSGFEASISFLGLWTREFAAMSRLYEQAYRLPVIRRTSSAVWFALAGGAELHLYDSSDDYHAFFGTAPVPGLFVADFDAAVNALDAAGVEWMTDPDTADDRIWRHYRAADGNIYEVMGWLADRSEGTTIV